MVKVDGSEYAFDYDVNSYITPDLVIRRRPGKPRQRRIRVVEHINHGSQIAAFNPNLNNMLASVIERQKFVKGPTGALVPPPKPNKALFFKRLSSFSILMKKHLSHVSRISREQFLSETPSDKRAIYTRAVESLLVEPLSKKDAHIKAFPKFEKLVLTPGKKLVPRCISPRSPRFNVEIGTFIRPLEKKVYQAIARIFRGKTVSKGDNAERMGQMLLRKWKKFTNPCCVGLDASRFDQHVSRTALEWSHTVYSNAFAEDRKFFESLLRMTIFNTCTFSSNDGFIKWKSVGGRMSGDMDTSLGNCLIMCALVYSYAKERGINIELYNNGDDCAVMMESHDCDRFCTGLSTWFLEMGFNMKVERPVFVFEHIEFCQTHPVMTPQGPICVRNFPACIDKDMVSVLPITNQKGIDNYFASIGKGGLALAGGIPILTNFYNRLVELSNGAYGWGNHPSLKSGMIHMAVDMKRVHSTPDWTTRVSFYEAFGVTPDEQVYWETKYNRLPCVAIGGDLPSFPYAQSQAYLSSPVRA